MWSKTKLHDQKMPILYLVSFNIQSIVIVQRSKKIRVSFCLLLAVVYVRTSFGGTLEVIDYDGQCLVWSKANHGCTGYSAPFAEPDGEDCSSGQLPDHKIQHGINELLELTEVINGVRTDFSVLNVDACGTENGLPAASIEVKQTRLVPFSIRMVKGRRVCWGTDCRWAAYVLRPTTYPSLLQSQPRLCFRLQHRQLMFHLHLRRLWNRPLLPC